MEIDGNEFSIENYHGLNSTKTMQIETEIDGDIVTSLIIIIIIIIKKLRCSEKSFEIWNYFLEST